MKDGSNLISRQKHLAATLDELKEQGHVSWWRLVFVSRKNNGSLARWTIAVAKRAPRTMGTRDAEKLVEMIKYALGERWVPISYVGSWKKDSPPTYQDAKVRMHPL